jgi:hypothetical protein
MKRFIFSLAISLLSTSLFADAAEDIPSFETHQTPSPHCGVVPHHFTVGGKYSRAYLKPKENPSFSGNMGGAQTSYEYKRPNFLYGGITFDWRYGSLDASNGSRKLNDIDVQERLGYTLQLSKHRVSLIFFTGFGFRQLRHTVDVSGMSSDKFYYNHFYIPVGVLSRMEWGSWFSLGFDLIWMAQMYPTVTIESIDDARFTITRKFTNVIAELPLIFHLDTYVKNLSISLIPQFELWQDGPTAATSPGGIPLGLPENTYIFWGGELNVTYAF